MLNMATASVSQADIVLLVTNIFVKLVRQNKGNLFARRLAEIAFVCHRDIPALVRTRVAVRSAHLPKERQDVQLLKGTVSAFQVDKVGHVATWHAKPVHRPKERQYVQTLAHVSVFQADIPVLVRLREAVSHAHPHRAQPCVPIMENAFVPLPARVALVVILSV